MTLFDVVFSGNDTVYGLTEGAIDAAIEKHGADKAIAFPDTAYSLPCYYAVTGTKVATLGQLKEALGVVKTLMTREQKLNDAFMSGVATALCAEFIEVLKYIDGAVPYEEPCYGHLADAVIRELGVPLVTGDILEFVKPALAKKGINLKIIEFTDYIQPNLALADKEIDANLFQHKPFMDKFCQDRGLKLTALPGIFIAPIALYSKKIKDVKELKKGDTITIPNDPTNGGRALQLLAGAGLLKLKEGVGHAATVEDIIDNPLRLRIVEVEAATLPRTLDDARAAVINQTYALPAGLNPVKDSLLIESKDSPYANMVAIRTGDNRPELVELNNALHTPEVKQFILEHYKGSLIPSF